MGQRTSTKTVSKKVDKENVPIGQEHTKIQGVWDASKLKKTKKKNTSKGVDSYKSPAVNSMKTRSSMNNQLQAALGLHLKEAVIKQTQINHEK